MAVEVDEKFVLGKVLKLAKIFYLNVFLSPSKNIRPNMKPYSERFLSAFCENGKEQLPSTINDRKLQLQLMQLMQKLAKIVFKCIFVPLFKM